MFLNLKTFLKESLERSGVPGTRGQGRQLSGPVYFERNKQKGLSLISSRKIQLEAGVVLEFLILRQSSGTFDCTPFSSTHSCTATHIATKYRQTFCSEVSTGIKRPQQEFSSINF